MKKEFEQFLAESESPPPFLTQKVMSLFENKMVPSLSQVLPRFIALYLIAGMVTLTVCPQFGLGPIGGGHGLSHIFMEIGLWACALFCGTFFVALSSIIASVFLTRSEVRTIQQSALWFLPVLSVSSLVLLMFFGSLFSDTSDLINPQYGAIWTLGGLLSSRLFFRLRNVSA